MWSHTRAHLCRRCWRCSWRRTWSAPAPSGRAGPRTPWRADCRWRGRGWWCRSPCHDQLIVMCGKYRKSHLRNYFLPNPIWFLLQPLLSNARARARLFLHLSHCFSLLQKGSYGYLTFYLPEKSCTSKKMAKNEIPISLNSMDALNR